MNITEFVHESVTALNSTMIDDVKELTPEQLAWQPAPNANPIGFIFWHFMRVQDGMIHGFQGKPLGAFPQIIKGSLACRITALDCRCCSA